MDESHNHFSLISLLWGIFFSSSLIYMYFKHFKSDFLMKNPIARKLFDLTLIIIIILAALGVIIVELYYMKMGP